MTSTVTPNPPRSPVSMASEPVERRVRILLTGDGDSGKTSLILALVSEQFPDRVPARAEEITIPADVTPEKVPTSIVDYSSREQTSSMLKDELVRANVVCIVYDVTSEESRDRLATHWLPFVNKETDAKKPIILVGNKDDLQQGSSIDGILHLMETYPQVETCVECSAKTLRNVSEMFYFAQKAVLHPAAPLYAADAGELTDRCARALRRIFAICDHDKDGLLDDVEINRFQKTCFRSELNQTELTNLKSVIQQNCPDGFVAGKITCAGFVHLHKVFVQRGRHETTWTVLRKFGYDDDVALRRDYLTPTDYADAAKPGVELSRVGIEFLSRLFQNCDRDKDGALNDDEVALMIGPLGAGSSAAPWIEDPSVAMTRNADGNLTLDGFLAYWIVKATIDVRALFTFCARLGFPYLTECPDVTRVVKTTEIQYTSSRKTFHCLVHAPTSKVASKFLRKIVENSINDDDDVDITYAVAKQSLIFYNAALVASPSWIDVHLVLSESLDEKSVTRVEKIVANLGNRAYLFAHVGTQLMSDGDAREYRRFDVPQPRFVNVREPKGHEPLVDELLAVARNPHGNGGSKFGGTILVMMMSFAVGLAAVFFTQKFLKR